MSDDGNFNEGDWVPLNEDNVPIESLMSEREIIERIKSLVQSGKFLDGEDHMELGSLYLEIGDYANEIKHYSLAIETNLDKEDKLESMFEIAQAWEWIGDLEKAIAIQKKGIAEKEIEETDSMYKLGEYLRKDGQDDAAIRAFTKSIEINSSNIGSFYGIFDILEKNGRRDEVVDICTKLRTSYPKRDELMVVCADYLCDDLPPANPC